MAIGPPPKTVVLNKKKPLGPPNTWSRTVPIVANFTHIERLKSVASVIVGIETKSSTPSVSIDFVLLNGGVPPVPVMLVSPLGDNV